MRDLISIHDLTKGAIEKLLATARGHESAGIPPDALRGRVVASLFFEPSTRTRLSFEAAIQRLGGGVIGFSGSEGTSMKKGESFEDTIRMVDGYADCIVVRHPDAGSAQRAAAVATHPVINGGDGPNEHPTQTLIDLYTILSTQGTLEGLRIALVGDLKYGRVPHSLAQALTHFPTTAQVWVATDAMRMPNEIRASVQGKGISVTETDRLEDVIGDVDILMMTRVQGERFADPAEYERVKDVYTLQPEMFMNVKKNLKILHPLPRLNEIPTSIDALPHAYYFEQAHHGMFVRAALLTELLCQHS